MITNADISLSEYITHKYIDDDNTVLKTQTFNQFGQLLIAQKPQIGESVIIKKRVKTYKKVDLDEEYQKQKEKQKNIERPFSKEETKVEKPGFFGKVVHHLKENIKESASEVDIYSVYKVLDVIHNLSDSKSEVIFYVSYVRDYNN